MTEVFRPERGGERALPVEKFVDEKIADEEIAVERIVDEKIAVEKFAVEKFAHEAPCDGRDGRHRPQPLESIATHR